MTERRRRHLAVPTAVALLLALFGSQPAHSSVPTPIRQVPAEDFIEFEVFQPPAISVVETRTSRPPPPTPRPTPTQTAHSVSTALVTPPPPSSSHRLSGVASWYCRSGISICARGYPASGMYAAAGPRLRAAICGDQSCTSWRGRYVSVNGVRVRLIDWCQCYRNESNEKIIDLYYSVFVRTGSRVTITW